MMRHTKSPTRFLFVTGVLCLLFSLPQLTHTQSKPQAAGPREQLQQYVTQLQANPTDDALRTKIIQLALTLDPKPAVPEEAQASECKAKTLFDHATSLDDLKAAAAAFAQASIFAPWVPNSYFNEAAALAETATKWRFANSRQKGLIDGPITGLQTANETGDLDGLIGSVAIIEKTENDLMPMLENSIENLPVPEGDTTCE